MNHVRELIHRSLEEPLGPGDQARMTEHLTACVSCAALQAELQRNDRLLGARDNALSLPPRRIRGRSAARVVGPLVGSAAVLALALIVGTQLPGWRIASQAGSPASPQPSPFGSPVDPRVDPRDQPAPPAVAIPTPSGWPGRTHEEVALNIGRDPFVVSVMRELVLPGAAGHDPRAAGLLSLGVPIYVKGFNEPLHDIWLVPVISNAEVIGAFSAPVLPNGRAVAGSYSGFVGRFPHPLPMADAVTKGSVPSDPDRKSVV